MKRKHIKFVNASSVLLVMLYLSFLAIPATALPICDINKIKIISKNKSLIYHVEVADTDYSRRRGLMYRKHLAPDHGMLFIFKKTQYVHMWMKNTEIKLDIIFVNDNGVITQIIRNASPMSEQVHSSNMKVKFVLEFPSYGKDISSIEIGNSILHCALGNHL